LYICRHRVQRPPNYPHGHSYRASERPHRYVLDEVRAADRDRFLAALFAPDRTARPFGAAGLRS
jgi:hypothetical protein